MEFLCILLFWSGLSFVHSQRIKANMYEPIKGASCFRRMNATHVTGCNSKMGGSVGVIHVVKEQSDIDFIVNVHPSPPYAAIIPPRLFTRENIMRFKNEASRYVSVIVLINSAHQLETFSHDSKCPNQFSGLIAKQQCDIEYPETTWNPFGTGLLQEDFPFPIYYVTDYLEIKNITDCFDKFNNFDLANQKFRSLCSIEVNTFMAAAVNSKVCLQRSNYYKNFQAVKYCDPLQGRNVYATLFPREIVDAKTRKAQRDEKFILVTTRMDTTSLFDGVGLGAYDSLVPFTAFISIAHFLAKALPERHNSTNPNVLFVVFNGESYDYIGSQRFVYDLQKGAFPTKTTSTNNITLENIEFMIDLGILDDVSNLTIYSARNFTEASKITEIIGKINRNFDLNTPAMNIVSEHLPPVSAQSFLKQNITFKSVIVTTPPKNKFYHSIYDDIENLGYSYANKSKDIDFTRLEDLRSKNAIFAIDSIQMKIRNVSSAIGISIYEMLTGDAYDKDLGVSSLLIDEFLYCFLESSDCPLFRAAGKPDAPRNEYALPPYRYISVYSSNVQEATYYTYKVLAFLVGQKYENFEKANCTQNPFYWFAGYSGRGECRLTTQNYTLAFSPAFLDDDYDWSSGQYSTWTESTWRELSARIFLKPSHFHETMTLTIGFVVMLISFVLVFLINSRSEVLFNQEPAAVPIAQPTQC